ncbi:MAG: hypothetical protein IKA75_02185, partial [Bacteroidaceae bacterium]|nr:hypothetical protein [Bacteroidaceae bacterium]
MEVRRRIMEVHRWIMELQTWTLKKQKSRHSVNCNGTSSFAFRPTKTAATYSPTLAVPSARSGLTSLFGMG